MKIKLTRLPATGGGLSSDKREVCVIEWGDPKDLPPGAEKVPNETPLSDWAEEKRTP